MKVLLFGATGMVGQGVLRECLLDPEVDLVQTVGRSKSALQHQKLREVIHQNFWNYADIEAALSGFDACFFCLGVSSFRMKEDAYEHLTYDLTMAAATTLARLNPQMTFVYVSGAGTDSSEKEATMWARIKGKTENAVMRLPFKAAYMFRPGIIQPLHGARSKTASYHLIYTLAKPLLSGLRRAFPNAILTTEEIGRAMLIVARSGAPVQILEVIDIRSLLKSRT
jgi:uncharacterized protein YbjT (DUF2867 family)